MPNMPKSVREEPMTTADPLDNPVWHALVGPHAGFAIGRRAARRYERYVAPFSAIAEPTAAAYADLAADLPARVEARLFRPTEEPTPEGWETTSARPIMQMVWDGPSLPPPLAGEAGIVRLGRDDIAKMLALVDAARPGPFEPRTIELGNYVGVRDAATGRLVAMAGERFRLPLYVELSAIAVHPEARGRGLGAALTAHLARSALTHGATPFLHVFPDKPAVSLYTRLGFRERARLWVLWRRPTPGGAK
jgi:GNAT superfamily N-acetyltransferase